MRLRNVVAFRKSLYEASSRFAQPRAFPTDPRSLTTPPPRPAVPTPPARVLREKWSSTLGGSAVVAMAVGLNEAYTLIYPLLLAGHYGLIVWAGCLWSLFGFTVPAVSCGVVCGAAYQGTIAKVVEPLRSIATALSALCFVGSCLAIPYELSKVGVSSWYFFTSFQHVVPWKLNDADKRYCMQLTNAQCMTDYKCSVVDLNCVTHPIGYAQWYLHTRVLQLLPESATYAADDSLGFNWKLLLLSVLPFLLLAVVLLRTTRNVERAACICLILHVMTTLIFFGQVVDIDLLGGVVASLRLPKWATLFSVKDWLIFALPGMRSSRYGSNLYHYVGSKFRPMSRRVRYVPVLLLWVTLVLFVFSSFTWIMMERFIILHADAESTSTIQYSLGQSELSSVSSEFIEFIVYPVSLTAIFGGNGVNFVLFSGQILRHSILALLHCEAVSTFIDEALRGYYSSSFHYKWLIIALLVFVQAAACVIAGRNSGIILLIEYSRAFSHVLEPLVYGTFCIQYMMYIPEIVKSWRQWVTKLLPQILWLGSIGGVIFSVGGPFGGQTDSRACESLPAQELGLQPPSFVSMTLGPHLTLLSWISVPLALLGPALRMMVLWLVKSYRELEEGFGYGRFLRRLNRYYGVAPGQGRLSVALFSRPLEWFVPALCLYQVVSSFTENFLVACPELKYMLNTGRVYLNDTICTTSTDYSFTAAMPVLPVAARLDEAALIDEEWLNAAPAALPIAGGSAWPSRSLGAALGDLCTPMVFYGGGISYPFKQSVFRASSAWAALGAGALLLTVVPWVRSCVRARFASYAEPPQLMSSALVAAVRVNRLKRIPISLTEHFLATPAQLWQHAERSLINF